MDQLITFHGALLYATMVVSFLTLLAIGLMVGTDSDS